MLNDDEGKIKKWLNKSGNFTHMLVICDIFDYENYPVYITSNENVEKMIERYSVNMQKVVEVYNFKMNIGYQLSQFKLWNI